MKRYVSIWYITGNNWDKRNNGIYIKIMVRFV